MELVHMIDLVSIGSNIVQVQVLPIVIINTSPVRRQMLLPIAQGKCDLTHGYLGSEKIEPACPAKLASLD